MELYISDGIRFMNIHILYRYKRSPRIQKFIENITQRGISANNDFEKQFYKFLNNIFYGKTIEKIQTCLILIGLVDKSGIHRILNRQSKCSFDDKFAECEKCNLFSINKEITKLKKPFYSEFRLLGLSILLM